MKRTQILILLVCFGFLAFAPTDKSSVYQTDYYSPYCVDGHGWLRGKGCDDNTAFTLDGSNQIGKRHEEDTKGHRWDNRYCKTGGRN